MPVPIYNQPFDVRLSKEAAKKFKLISKVWKSEAIRFTSGPILKIRSGRLRGNIYKKTGVNRLKGKHWIEVGTRAMNPRDNFPYGAWHEFGRLRVRPKERVAKALGRQYVNKLKGKGAGGTGRAYLLHALDKTISTTGFRQLYPSLRRALADQIRTSFRP